MSPLLECWAPVNAATRSLVLLAGALAAPPAPAAISSAPVVPAAQESVGESAPVLRLARFEVELSDPTRADVRVSLELGGGAPLELTMVWFDGQRIEDLRVRQDAAELALRPEGEGRVRRLHLPAVETATRSLYLEYTVAVASANAFRFPLPVPDVSADPAGSAVVVEVLLPADTVYRDDGFPSFARAGEREGRRLLRARVVGVPGFVHVVFGRQGDLLGAPARIQAVALAFVLLPLAIFTWRAWRRRQRAEPS